MSFVLPPLPYPAHALEPFLSRETLAFHHGKHHKTYVENMNRMLEIAAIPRMTLEDLIQSTPQGPLWNNAAQTWNHQFYWQSLSPDRTQPTPTLQQAIDKSFGSFSDFQATFTDVALKTFGSGWAWLVRKPDHSLAVISTSNAGCPLIQACTPLLTCDVWEHAYYIDYRNARAAYLEAFWSRVDWEQVSKRMLEPFTYPTP